MPWKVAKRGSKWIVISETSGRVMGEHPSREKALAQVRALYAKVPESRKKGGGRKKK